MRARRDATTTAGCVVLLAAMALAVAPPARAGDDAPAWVKQIAATTTSQQPKGTEAIVLLDDGRKVVSPDGRVTTTQRGALKVLTREGRGAAIAQLWYPTDTAKVKDFRAWLVKPSGQVSSYGKSQVVDRAAALDDVYNESRIQVIYAGEEAEPGAVFAYEYTVEDRSVFTQDEWEFQRRLPVVVSRYTLSLPEGWRAEAVTFNHAAVDPTVAGTTWTWELRDLGRIEEEPAGPPVTNLAPRLAVSYFPPDAQRNASGRTFASWDEVARWLSELSDSQAVASDALTAKANELTTSAETELDRIRAIGRYVQGVNYIAIQTGIGRGGGYRPHTAADVFAKSYGDCKDKANLMRTMLKAVGIEAHLVSIYSGDPTYVREQWASPQQFNHCIVAVKVGASTSALTTIDHPALGKLLLFDPTDPHTPVGDLPDHEQGSLALVIAPTSGALVRVPVVPPEANRMERTTEAQLAPDGSITVSLSERSTGAPAVDERRFLKDLARPEYNRKIESWIVRSVNGATVSKVTPVDNLMDGRFALDVEFSAARYAQLMQGRLFVFKPAIVSRLEALTFTEPSRTQPVVLPADAFSETARIKLPEGFDVDELPDPAKLEAPFGVYSTAYEVKDGYLIFTRSMTLRAATIPVAEYAAVRGFFEHIRDAEQSPVVLVRK